QDTPENRHTLVWWSILRKYMKGGGTGNWDNAVGIQDERMMRAYHCPTALNRDAGCDYGANPVIFPDALAEAGLFVDFPIASSTSRRITGPAKLKSLYPDNVMLWDQSEIPPNFTTQFCIGYGVDSKRMMNLNGVTGYRTRFRGNPVVAANPAL